MTRDAVVSWNMTVPTDPRVEELVRRIGEGHRVRAEELSVLLETGCDPGVLLDALVAAAEGPQSRLFHRALGMLRDLRRR